MVLSHEQAMKVASGLGAVARQQTAEARAGVDPAEPGMVGTGLPVFEKTASEVVSGPSVCAADLSVLTLAQAKEIISILEHRGRQLLITLGAEMTRGMPEVHIARAAHTLGGALEKLVQDYATVGRLMSAPELPSTMLR